MNEIKENKSMFVRTPMCEVCRKKEANCLSCFFVGDAAEWKYCCECTIESEDYHIKFSKFFHSPSSTIGWIGHMNEKTWFDGKDFVDMLTRLQRETDSST